MFQPPVDYGSLNVTQEHRNQEGVWVYGMCYFSGRLYTTERRKDTGSYWRRLAVYSVTDQDTVPLLGTLDMDGDAREPRLDRHSGLVYVPCETSGVSVVRYDDIKLDLVTTMKCVGDAASLAVVLSRNTLYVSDWDSYTVCLVDVNQDRVTARVQVPREVMGERPNHIAVLGDTVLIVYGGNTLVIYRHNVHIPGKVILEPQGLRSVRSLTTDDHFSFLLTCSVSNTVYVLDIAGNLTHTIPIPGDREPQACTVVGGQLWVACDNGDIIVMLSSQ